MLRISDYAPKQRDREVAATHRGSFCPRSHHSRHSRFVYHSSSH